MAQVRTETQFSIFLVNKPGVLAQVTRAIADAKINIIAMTLVDSQEHGVLRLVIERRDEAREVLKKLNLPMTETDVLAIEVSNRPGALADIAQVLGENHININYAYSTGGAPGGRSTAILKVADPRKAERVLKPTKTAAREPNLGRRGRR